MQQSAANQSSLNENGISIKVKGNGIPWYIISQDNKVLRFFRIMMSLMAVPSVILNLFL